MPSSPGIPNRSARWDREGPRQKRWSGAECKRRAGHRFSSIGIADPAAIRKRAECGSSARSHCAEELRLTRPFGIRCARSRFRA